MADAEETITRSARFYRLHREEQLARKKQEYDANPEVIARRQKAAQLKAAREQERQAKQIEKARNLQEKIEKAIATSQKKSKNPGAKDCPAL